MRLGLVYDVTLRRRTPLRAKHRAQFRRLKQLRRDGPGARAFAAQRSELPRESQKTKDRRPERDAVVAAVRTRDRTCQLATAVPQIACWGPLDVDEIIPRGQWREGQYVEANCWLLCRGHHDWKHLNFDEAVAIGARRPGWEAPLR